jgi:hypothetical protein
MRATGADKKILFVKLLENQTLKGPKLEIILKDIVFIFVCVFV